jgi:hypothetical protein
MERDYKVAAQLHLVRGAPLDVVLRGDKFDVAAVLKCFQTNMLSVFEAARVSQVLRGEQGREFVQAAAAFAA